MKTERNTDKMPGVGEITSNIKIEINPLEADILMRALMVAELVIKCALEKANVDEIDQNALAKELGVNAQDLFMGYSNPQTLQTLDHMRDTLKDPPAS